MVPTNCIFFIIYLATLCHGFSTSVIRSRRNQISLHSTTSENPTEVTGQSKDDGISLVDLRTGKPTGISYLPSTTIQRARENGSPIEKIKLEKDGTSAFVDVYEYARKIRDGEMTWEEVDKADLDTVCAYHL
jgi:hypothetical protein